MTEVGLRAVRWVDPFRTSPDEAGSVTANRVNAQSNWTRSIVDQLAEYFGGTRTTFDLPLDWRGLTTSQDAVLRTLFDTVGFGESITYGGLAARSGTTVPARGIGALMGSNRIPIVVGCHRVLASDGLGGYSGGFGSSGLETKRWLLTFEGVLPPILGWDPTAPMGAATGRSDTA
ncbi:MAG: cysteine methyltransferase [Frankiales bacterium]|nr:cysteine methyltransferase [Frankiales bacterium]